MPQERRSSRGTGPRRDEGGGRWFWAMMIWAVVAMAVSVAVTLYVEANRGAFPEGTVIGDNPAAGDPPATSPGTQPATQPGTVPDESVLMESEQPRSEGVEE